MRKRLMWLPAILLACVLPQMAVPAMASQVVTAGQAGNKRTEAGPHQKKREPLEVDRFLLPENARVLVVVEGTNGSSCRVSAYERAPESGSGWNQRVDTAGILGHNGMSNHRTAGDRTTPIGVFQMNTPFGQDEPLEGFPDNYVQVTETYVWESETNRLEADSMNEGERVGTEAYAGYYDYVLDAGYNIHAFPAKGAALFLHCQVEGAVGTAGCVAIPKDQMAVIMLLYGKYGDGACYIAQAPEGTFPLIYDSYGKNNGLSPEGDFGI